MRGFKTLFLLIAISLFITACSGPPMSTGEKIVSPRNQLIPVKGTWEISQVLENKATKEEINKEEWIGKKVRFSESYISIGESILENPRYQMKRVNGRDYFLYNYKSLPENFVLSSKEVEVITILEEDKFFSEALKISEEELVLEIQNNSFYLTKISDEVEEVFIIDSKKEEEKVNLKADVDDLLNTGVLIGLRSPVENGKEESSDYTYRTVWIASSNNEMHPILQTEDIFFPRRSGFWKIEVNKIKKDKRTEDFIFANNISMEESIKKKEMKAEIESKVEIESKAEIMDKELDRNMELDFSRWGEKIGEIKRIINYVGNDYVSVETTGTGGYIKGDEKWEKSKFQLLPTDGLPNGKGIKMSDILGEAGVISMKSAWEETINSSNIDKSNILYREELIENFGLERKLGHWFFKGRINYIMDKNFALRDYNISLIPPSKVVFYDELSVPWTNIKDRVPGALDAFTSPNKDIAIIATANELLIYDITGNDLYQYPKERIALKTGETVIMAEWATGHYAESWENKFKDMTGSGQ